MERSVVMYAIDGSMGAGIQGDSETPGVLNIWWTLVRVENIRSGIGKILQREATRGYSSSPAIESARPKGGG